MNNIVFVTGFPRSGTTLLATILSRHNKLCTMGETHYFLATNLLPILPKTKRWWNNYIANNRRFQMIDYRLTDDEESDKKMTRDEYFSIYSSSYAKTKHAEWFVEKSPVHVDVIPSIRKAYPDAPIINIVRDVRDTTHSMLESPWAHNDPLKHMIEWRCFQRQAKRFEKKYQIGMYQVKYEDLLSKPEETIAAILKYISPELEFSEVLLTDSKALDAIPDYEKAWKSKAAEKPDVSRLNAWKKAPQPWHKYAAICNKELESYGYEPCVERDISLKEKCIAWVYSTSAYRNLRVFVKLRSIYDR